MNPTVELAKLLRLQQKVNKQKNSFDSALLGLGVGKQEKLRLQIVKSK